MNDQQFKELMEKIEQIRTGIIDMENTIQTWINLQPKPKSELSRLLDNH